MMARKNITNWQCSAYLLLVDVPGMSPGKRACLTAPARNITSYRHLSSQRAVCPLLAAAYFRIAGFSEFRSSRELLLFWPCFPST